MSEERGMGDNSRLTEQERRTLFAHHFRHDMAVEAKMRALKEERKENRLKAKAAGFPASKIDHYLKSFYAEDQQKPVDKLRSDRENLAWLGLIPDDPKGDLLADRATNEQTIYAKGHNAGLLNLERVSGYDAGSSDNRTWLDGYDKGQQEFKDNLAAALAKIEVDQTNEEPEADGSDPFPAAAE